MDTHVPSMVAGIPDAHLADMTVIATGLVSTHGIGAFIGADIPRRVAFLIGERKLPEGVDRAGAVSFIADSIRARVGTIADNKMSF